MGVEVDLGGQGGGGGGDVGSGEGVGAEVEEGVGEDSGKGRGKRQQKAAVGSTVGRREICFDALVFAIRAGNLFYRYVWLIFLFICLPHYSTRPVG